jgi:hypothetical protein
MLESLMPLQVTLPNEAIEKSSDDLAIERCLHQAYFKDLRDRFPVLALHVSHIPVAPISSIPSMAQRNDPRLRSSRLLSARVASKLENPPLQKYSRNSRSSENH